MNYAAASHNEQVAIGTDANIAYFGRWLDMRQFKLAAFQVEIITAIGSGAYIVLQGCVHGDVSPERDRYPPVPNDKIAAGTDYPFLASPTCNISPSAKLVVGVANYILQAELAVPWVRFCWVNGGSPPPAPFAQNVWSYFKS